MPECLTLGETMAAFAPDRTGPLRYVPNYSLRIAGAESNTAIGAAKLGVSAAWISRLGADEFGQYIRNQIRAEGVDCSGVHFDPAHRTGVMFKQTGSGESSVFYYRENSAASHMTPQDLDEALFRGCRILHLSGITPVLSESCAETVQAAIRLAQKYGARVSFDPNIRQKLWNGRDYTPLLRQLTTRAEIVLMGLDEAEVLFGTRNVEQLCAGLFAVGHTEVAAFKDGSRGAWIATGTSASGWNPIPAAASTPSVQATASTPVCWQAFCRDARWNRQAAWARCAGPLPPKCPAMWRVARMLLGWMPF